LTWTVALGSEFTAAGMLMQRWFPLISVWIWSGLFAAVIFILNILTVKFFAESEFWFVLVKVLAIVLFIILGVAAIVGFIPMESGANASLFA
ncbi:S-methylmethionine permease, partial [Staphylococcus sp. SIMBA_130]